MSSFGEAGFNDMLKDFDYDFVDKLTLFTGAIVGIFCRPFEAAEAINICTDYVDVATCMYKSFSAQNEQKPS